MGIFIFSLSYNEREIKDLRRLLTGDDISKMEFSIQQLLYSVFVVRIN